MAPSDGCPYHRPFDEYFLECPNYQREPFAAQNLRGAPLATVRAKVRELGSPEA